LGPVSRGIELGGHQYDWKTDNFGLLQAIRIGFGWLPIQLPAIDSNQGVVLKSLVFVAFFNGG
jgi:hypothetical protein